MPIRALLFDKDGTLVDFDKTWSEAFLAVVTEITGGDEVLIDAICDYSGYDRKARKIRPDAVFIASSNADYGAVWARILGVEADKAFLTGLNARFHHHSSTTLTPIGNPLALFETLQSHGYTLAIVTNDSERGARAHCELLGLTGHLTAFIGYDSGYGQKPEPGQILGFMAKHGFAADEVAMIGDTLHDLHAARAAGVTAIAVLSGHADGSVLGPHADHVISDIMALPHMLGHA